MSLRLRTISAGVIIAIGVVIRLTLAVTTTGFLGDLEAFGAWGERLAHEPLTAFYEVDAFNLALSDGVSDHLPGDLYLHVVIARAFAAFGGVDFHSTIYYTLVRVPPILADYLVAGLAWWICRQLWPRIDGRVPLAGVLLNPASFLISSAWGQWDSVSMVPLLAGVAIVLTQRWCWLWSIPLFALAVTMKPPLAAIALASLLIVHWRWFQGWRAKRMSVTDIALQTVAAAAIGSGSMQVILWPFRVGLPGIPLRWNFLDRVQIAVDLWPIRTMGAANLWALTPAGFGWTRDDTPWLGWTAHGWGNLLLGLAMLGIVIVVLRQFRHAPSLSLVIWAMSTDAMTYFMLPTRVHERYLYPAVIMLGLLAMSQQFRNRSLMLWLGVSATSSVNLLLVLTGYGQSHSAWLAILLAIANVALYGALLITARSIMSALSPAVRTAIGSRPAASGSPHRAP